MGAKAASEPWVGRPLPRLEDEALLRGEGRFIDDLDPVANARHAAVLRSPFAHARITRLDASAALELPGVVGVLTGADVAELSRPVPGRHRLAGPALRGRARGRALRRASPSPSSSRATATSPRTRSS